MYQYDRVWNRDHEFPAVDSAPKPIPPAEHNVLTGAKVVLKYWMDAAHVKPPEGKIIMLGTPTRFGITHWCDVRETQPVFLTDVPPSEWVETKPTCHEPVAELLFEVTSEELLQMFDAYGETHKAMLTAEAMGVRREVTYRSPNYRLRKTLREVAIRLQRKPRELVFGTDRGKPTRLLSGVPRRDTVGYGAPNWATAATRVWSSLYPMDPIKRELRLELVQGLREWPRCKAHDCEVEIRYKRSSRACGGEKSPLILAAFGCKGCHQEGVR